MPESPASAAGQQGPKVRLPLFTFDVLWRARRCPRRFRSYLAGTLPQDSRLITWEILHRSAHALMGSSDDDGLDEMDLEFQALQEDAVRCLSRHVLVSPVEIRGESLWEEEGETLRELGWMAAASPAHQKTLSINKDTWVQALGAMQGLYRPVIKHQNLLARPDYLLRSGEGEWVLVFVRASSKVKDALVSEAEYTRFVCACAGMEINQLWLLHTAETYERSQEEAESLDPGRFFSLSPLNSLVKHMSRPLSADLRRMVERAMRNDTCAHRRDCPLCSDGADSMSEDSIYTLHRPGRVIQMLEEEGIYDLSQMDRASPESRKELKDRHLVQLQAVKTQNLVLRRPGLSAFLDSLQPPFSFLDFESTAEVLPPVPGLRPWEHIPFLYSLHTLDARVDLKKLSAMAAEVEGLTEHSCIIDPASPPLEALIAFARDIVAHIPEKGSILAYGAPFEIATLNRLARICPDQKNALEALARRVVDLQIPFMNFDCYHPLQRGKLSLKRILPLLTDQTHQDLRVKSGGEAHLQYYFWRESIRNPGGAAAMSGLGHGKGSLQADLVSYCRMDTLGLVHLLRKLAILAA